MFTKMLSTLMLTLLLTTVGFAAEPSKSSLQAAVAAPSAAPALQAAAPAQSQAAVVAAPAPAPVSGVPTKIKPNRAITISMFFTIIGITLCVVIWAARSTKSASDFYTAGGGITGLQNGWAIAGDYMSAASFLGMSGLISLYGIDGFMYAVGPMFSFIAILLVIAEPCRNAGKFTLGDILSFRTAPKPVRAVAAISTVTVSLFYLIAQMVGAGKLMQVLLDIPYRVSVIGVGVLMVGYVVFGGMKATTWVQIIKAGLLMSGTVLLAFLVICKGRFQPDRFLHRYRRQPAYSGSCPDQRTQGCASQAGLRLWPAFHGAGTVPEESARPDLARHRLGAGRCRPAAHPDALLYRAECQGSPQIHRYRTVHQQHLLLPDQHHRLRRRALPLTPADQLG